MNNAVADPARDVPGHVPRRPRGSMRTSRAADCPAAGSRPGTERLRAAGRWRRAGLPGATALSRSRRSRHRSDTATATVLGHASRVPVIGEHMPVDSIASSRVPNPSGPGASPIKRTITARVPPHHSAGLVGWIRGPSTGCIRDQHDLSELGRVSTDDSNVNGPHATAGTRPHVHAKLYVAVNVRFTQNGGLDGTKCIADRFRLSRMSVVLRRSSTTATTASGAGVTASRSTQRRLVHASALTANHRPGSIPPPVRPVLRLHGRRRRYSRRSGTTLWMRGPLLSDDHVE